ncbi:ABC transporter substrate-binding protein [Pontibacillus salipaludis]|uniref:Histidine ABC transporter substrate-binding protein n=1 Tax=Pontibacillus salipaludis TaxID=1697394 RepID=A0ABQ1Q869_9BACI|nr:ABC transporter substrate-binding protein [Pontibacillus salipaludis]GGD16181.1 histidine ABC transporter substrate-binding protein [Pontibacillus salipaludis]
MRNTFTLLLMTLLVIVLSACSGETQSESDSSINTITFADPGWDSVRVHNQIAATIIENGFGYSTEVTAGSTPATVQGLRNGDINVYMELWTDNIKEIYNEAKDKGDIIETSINFDDNEQGYYVPTYVIEGDQERGIEPIAPDLKTVEDLKDYKEVFQDPEQPEMGRVYGSPSGWAVDAILEEKVKTYGLEDFNYFRPGSGAALATSLADAYESGEAWVGYYWSPTWVTSIYDLTLLEEPEYNKEQYQKDYGTEIPPMKVTTAVHKDMPELAPEVVDFIKQYETSNELTQSALEYMRENGTNAKETAHWWMKEHEDVWTEWVSEEVVTKVKGSL